MSTGTFDVQVSNILRELEQEARENKVSRVNSPMILRALLQAEESPLYNALLAQLMEDITCFPEMVEETYEYINYYEAEDASSEEVTETEESKCEENVTEESEEPGDMEVSQSDEEYPSIIFRDKDGEKTIVFDDDVREFLALLVNCLQNGVDVDIWRFTALFVHTMSQDVRRIFRTFGVRTELLKNYFEARNESAPQAKTVKVDTKPFTIPMELKDFVRNLNEELQGEICDVSGRDKECKLVWQTLSKKTKRNVILIGEPGVGKTSIVMKITHDIVSGTCPDEFKDAIVLAVDVTASVAGTMYRGQAEQRFSALVDFLENQPNVILFIDEIHLINGAGACREGEIDLANTLKPILAGGKARVIGATTAEEYEKYFSRDGATKRRFRPVYVEEPKLKEVYPMLMKSIETLELYHNVSISKDMVDYIIINSACFNNETRNPDRTKDLIDLSMVVAKQAGKTEVDKESVLANFAYNFKRFEKMSEYTKRSTAYHEAGHCLVGLGSKELSDYDVIAVSIMPAEDYLGLTVFDNNEVTQNTTMDYLIDKIAMRLAGRVAEEMFTSTITAGASSDLQNATRMAKDIVTRFGMMEFGKNRTYYEDNQSEEAKNKINAAIDEIIGRAMERANVILLANMEILESLVEALMKNGIVGPKELTQIVKNIKKI